MWSVASVFVKDQLTYEECMLKKKSHRVPQVFIFW